MDIQIGSYKNTGYAFSPNSKIINVFGFPWLFDQSVIKLVANQTGLNNSNVGFVIGAPTLWNATISGSTPTTTLTAGFPTAGGSVTTGTHSYVVSYVYSSGDETFVSRPSNIINITGSSKTVLLSNIPTGNAQVTARNIYRTAAGNAGNYLLLTTLTVATGTTFSDTIADTSLTTTPPITTNVYDIKYFSTLPTLNANDKIFIRVEIPDETVDTGLNVNKTINQTPEWGHYIDQYEPIDYTNQAAGITRDVLYIAGYSKLMLGVTSSVGAASNLKTTFQVPNKSTSVDTDDVNWKDVTKYVTSINSSGTTSGVNYIYLSPGTSFSENYLINNLNYERLMVKTVFSGASVNTHTISNRLS
jgi:hypothetical protein